MAIRTLIVDDEPLARERLTTLLEDEPDIQVVGECGDGRSAVRAIKSKTPDLVLLDIQLPEMDGFELVDSIPSNRTLSIIFVTAYDQFAVRAFQVHALDYLLKPVEGLRLREALQRLRKNLHPDAPTIRNRVRKLMEDLSLQQGQSRRLVLKADGEVLLLKPSEIDWVESAGNYVCFHVGSETHIFRETMNQVEHRFSDHNFMRIHRSAIVNMDRVKRLKPTIFGDYSVELRNGTKLKMSRGYKGTLLKKVDAM